MICTNYFLNLLILLPFCCFMCIHVRFQSHKYAKFWIA
ncbi:putative signal peptide protein [Puccinia sorghi]|uniref:Putative signal peptide protein n=1 Tax=Puccinia sorghi TaxID=27349 RepID=A0A0L6UR53_9BASI|nr:putative signal peptide protein [Puccinia sorghi]